MGRVFSHANSVWLITNNLKLFLFVFCDYWSRACGFAETRKLARIVIIWQRFHDRNMFVVRSNQSVLGNQLMTGWAVVRRV